jgi:hypothetical protein
VQRLLFGRSGITVVTAGLPAGFVGRVVAFDFVFNKAFFSTEVYDFSTILKKCQNSVVRMIIIRERS